MSSPRVTVGLPVYNGAKHLDEAIAALVGQSFKDFTLLVSDNASTDATAEILEGWASRDSRIHVHRQEVNLGHTGNFQYVLDHADTEFFLWHASDDWVSRGYLDELFKTMQSERGCDFVAPKIIHVNRDGTPVEEIPMEHLDASSRFRRTRTLLARSQGHRIYGLFRTTELRKAKALAQRFGYVWGWDAVAQLPFVLGDSMRGTDGAVLYYRLNEGFSMKLYKPQTPGKLLVYWVRYLRMNIGIWASAPMPLVQKLACLPWVLYHSTHSLGLKPLRALGKFLRRWARKLFRFGIVKPIRAVIHRQ